jgi:hypothetical protein
MWKFDAVLDEKYSVKRWYHILMDKNNFEYDFLIDCIEDAKTKQTIQYNSKYYSCAKFIY